MQGTFRDGGVWQEGGYARQHKSEQMIYLARPTMKVQTHNSQPCPNQADVERNRYRVAERCRAVQCRGSTGVSGDYAVQRN